MDFRSTVDRTVGGDLEARDALVRQFYPRVRELVHRELQRGFRQRHRWILPLFSTGDIVHEVFQQVLAELERFEGGDEETFEPSFKGVEMATLQREWEQFVRELVLD